MSVLDDQACRRCRTPIELHVGPKGHRVVMERRDGELVPHTCPQAHKRGRNRDEVGA